MDSCVLEAQASINELLRVRSQQANSLEQNSKNTANCPAEYNLVYVDKLQILDDASIVVHLTDNTRHIYEAKARLWSELQDEIKLLLNCEHQVRTSNG